MAAFQLLSDAFSHEETIPTLHTADGENLSPQLGWTSPPEETRSLALIVDDPDAPRRVWTHWLLYDIATTTNAVAQGVPREQRVMDLGVQGRNDFGAIGYGGPAPPRGPAHRYRFRLYALDRRVPLPGDLSKDQLLGAIERHVLAVAELVGRYGRS